MPRHWPADRAEHAAEQRTLSTPIPSRQALLARLLQETARTKNGVSGNKIRTSETFTNCFWPYNPLWGCWCSTKWCLMVISIFLIQLWVSTRQANWSQHRVRQLVWHRTARWSSSFTRGVGWDNETSPERMRKNKIKSEVNYQGAYQLWTLE